MTSRSKKAMGVDTKIFFIFSSFSKLNSGLRSSVFPI
jgi:hypothetical protein